jgi:hypothetical protein
VKLTVAVKRIHIRDIQESHRDVDDDPYSCRRSQEGQSRESTWKAVSSRAGRQRRKEERLTEGQKEGEIGLSKDLEEELHRKPEGHHRDKVHPARAVGRR